MATSKTIPPPVASPVCVPNTALAYTGPLAVHSAVRTACAWAHQTSRTMQDASHATRVEKRKEQEEDMQGGQIQVIKHLNYTTQGSVTNENDSRLSPTPR